MSTHCDYDVAVIGGGPGGYVAAIKAAQAGKKTVLIEEKQIGGVCLNEGCIPTKTLLKSVNVLETVRRAGAFAVSGLDHAVPAIDMAALQTRKRQIVQQLTGGVASLLRANGVTVVSEHASFVDDHTLQAGERRLTAEHIIVATGSRVSGIPIRISEDAQVLTSREVLELDKLPEHAVIIGGGVVGVELAFFLAGAGAKVTVLELMDRILPMVDRDVTDKLVRMLGAKNIKILTGAGVKAIQPGQVQYEWKGEAQTVEADAIVMAAGRSPDFTGLNVEALGLKMDRRAIWVDEHLRTSVPHIYAIGDVNGKSMLAHTASMEAEAAVQNLCGGSVTVDYGCIPSCIYLSPELACVGLTEEQAREKNADVRVGVFPLAANGKSMVEGETGGFIKVIVGGNDQVLGVHMMGPHCTDMIGEIVVAMRGGLSSRAIIHSVHPHPTVSEAIPEAFMAAYGEAVHIK